MPYCAAEHVAFLSDQAHRCNSHRDVLWRDHLASDSTGGVGGGEQKRIHTNLVRCSEARAVPLCPALPVAGPS